MKKWIFISISLSLLVLVGSFLFINKNYSTKKVPERNYVVVKWSGIDYPFELTYPKNESIKDALNEIGIFEAHKIYEIKGRVKSERSINDFLISDCALEVQLN